MRTQIDTGALIAEMESESLPRPTLDLDTDNFQSQEANLTASEHQVSRGMAHSVRAIYSTKSVLGRVRSSCMLVLRLCSVMIASQHVVDTR